MQINKILWPTDLSDLSAKALPYVLDLSMKYGAQVILVYVADDMRRYDHIYGDAGDHLKGLQAMERHRAQEEMDKLCDHKLDGCPAFAHHLVQGEPAREILRLIADEEADLVVMCTHSREAKEGESAFFGSVTEKVIKHSPAPVLVVNPLQAPA
ncbi:MAG: universal stress protein [Deltaproteobacteria bacterium]|nr:universal stress protein [Deltaproteobacteria bacterium]